MHATQKTVVHSDSGRQVAALPAELFSELHVYGRTFYKMPFYLFIFSYFVILDIRPHTFIPFPILVKMLLICYALRSCSFITPLTPLLYLLNPTPCNCNVFPDGTIEKGDRLTKTLVPKK